MKTIIVPLDFSNDSLPGLNLALILAKRNGAKVKMVHVIGKEDDTDSDSVEKEHQRITAKFEDILKKQKEKNNPTLSLTYTIKQGKIFKEVTDLADEFEDSLIVLSAHGESGFVELFIGGNAFKITSHSKNPVITVRGSKVSSNIDKIVLPLDITYQTREKVAYTARLAKYFNSEIHLLSIRRSNLEGIEKKLHQYVEQIASYLGKQNIPVVIQHLKGDNLTDLTLDYARSVDANLISIMMEQEHSVSNLLLGTYAHQMINKAFVPVLLFPNYQLRIVTEDVWDLGAFNPRS